MSGERQGRETTVEEEFGHLQLVQVFVGHLRKEREVCHRRGWIRDVIIVPVKTRLLHQKRLLRQGLGLSVEKSSHFWPYIRVQFVRERFSFLPISSYIIAPETHGSIFLPPILQMPPKFFNS